MFKKLFKTSFINLFIVSCFSNINNFNNISSISIERGLYSTVRPNLELEKITIEEDKRIIKGETAILEVKNAKKIISIKNTSFKDKKNNILFINKNQFTYQATLEGCDDLEIEYIDNDNEINKGYACIPVATEAEITFIIYLAGDNNLNGGSYSYSASQDMVLKDLGEVQNAIVDRKALNIIVFLDITDKALYEYKKDKNSIISTGIYKMIDGKLTLQKVLPEEIKYQSRSDNINTGKKETLIACLNAGYNLSKSKKVILEVWGHGNSLGGVGFDDDKKSSCDSLDLTELKEGIKESKIEKIDILNFSACLMMGIEVFYELKDYVKYISGSPEFVPGDGSYYGYSNGILTWISKNYSSPLKEMAIEISRLNFKSYLSGGAQYIESSEYEYFLSYSTVDLTQMNEEFIQNLKNLFNKLKSEHIKDVQKDLLHYGKSYNPSKEITEYCDFVDLLNKLEANNILKEEILQVKNSLENFLIYNENINSKYSGITKSGFSIYYETSYFGSRYDSSSDFGKDTGWNKLLLRN